MSSPMPGGTGLGLVFFGSLDWQEGMVARRRRAKAKRMLRFMRWSEELTLLKGTWKLRLLLNKCLKYHAITRGWGHAWSQ